MKKSGYVVAGFETLASIIDNFFKGRHGRFNDNFTREQISNFLSSTTSGFLHSYGQEFPNKKKYGKYNEKEGSLFKKCRDMELFNGCNFIVDSGGFQISIGRLSKRESELLYDMYYEWLVDYKDVYDRAFILDIPPGPNCVIFEDFNDVYTKNLDSYKRAQSLPDEIRDKIIYIHHFRTPKLSQIYTKIMRENNLFDSFKYHGTGGIVANMSSDMTIPCIIYILPLIPLINEAKKFNRTILNFHVLGGANFRDVLVYELMTKIVKEKHGIDLNITYDSSGLFKQIMQARYSYAKTEMGYYKKLNLRSDNIKYKYSNDESIETVLQTVLNEFANRWGFKEISVDGVYDPSRNTFWEDVKVYLLLYALDLYYNIQQEMRDFAEEVYPIFDNGDLNLFYRKCFEIMRVINQGNLTKKQTVKAYNIPRSLSALSTLNEDYCQNIITQCLSQDEFSHLLIEEKILKI